MISRRRFICLAAASAGLMIGAAPSFATFPLVYRWRGIALGAAASLTVHHERAQEISERALLELQRLEQIFSLYRPSSELSRLNTDGRLANPSFEMLKLLSLCGSLNARTDGAFNPAVQPLWKLYAEKLSTGARPSDQDIASIRPLCDWSGVRVDPREVSFSRPGMALTLNGIAQGYIADKITQLLRQEGVENTLVNMGEIAALGHQADGQPWNIGIADPQNRERVLRDIKLENAAIATSSSLGTILDERGEIGHILDPATGKPATGPRQISVIAPDAAVADGLSTAFCLMDDENIEPFRREYRILIL